jgi:hypothetical protein
MWKHNTQFFNKVNKVKKKRNVKNRYRAAGFYRSKFLILFLFPLFSTFPVFSQIEDDEPREDIQFRGEVEVAVPIYNGLYLTLGGDLRLGQVAENCFARGEAGFLYKQRIGKYLTVVPRFRYRAEQLFGGTSTTENRLSADGIVYFNRSL